MIARLIEVPKGWENGGDFLFRFDGVGVDAEFGEVENVVVKLRFESVRSFRFIAEGTIDQSTDKTDPLDALLSELPLPDPRSPSSDHYRELDGGKGRPRLFRLFHYKAGLFEVVASTWQTI